MPADPGPRRFETTHWSLVIKAGDIASPGAAAALATLCETYWFPVYAFVRRSGRSPEDAQDLTQGFFTRVLEKNYFKDARQERGRFRAFLLTSVRHFLANQRDWDRATKRGGGQPHLSLEFDDGERRYQIEPVENETPEHIYERRWAMAALDLGMRRLAATYEGEARQKLYEKLRPFLTGEDPQSYASIARELDMTEGALRVAAHRLRQQFAACLREVIAETVDGPGDVADELRHLMTVVSR
jgi:RNA polymerase sigma-70 factor (ECF subfamily)